jgi:hypothetical protein
MERMALLGIGSAASLLLVSCTFNPTIQRAESVRLGNEDVVTVSLRPADADRIKNRQLYFSLVVFDCAGSREGFPATPYIGEDPAADFTFPVSGEIIQVVGRVPTAIFESYDNPCVFLRGGGYFTGKIVSAPAPVTVAASGPN